MILYIICGFVCSSWILPLYSIVTYMEALKTVDFIVEGFDKAKVATIITTKPAEICKQLSEVFGAGAFISITETSNVLYGKNIVNEREEEEASGDSD